MGSLMTVPLLTFFWFNMWRPSRVQQQHSLVMKNSKMSHTCRYYRRLSSYDEIMTPSDISSCEGYYTQPCLLMPISAPSHRGDS